MTTLAPMLRPQEMPAPRLKVTTCEVLLDEIEVMADIGAYAAEMGVLQPLRLHVALTIVPPQSDDLGQTFNYAHIRDHARDLAAQRINLIETFALMLARKCLECDLVLEAIVRIDKPLAVPGCLAGTRLRLARA